MSKLIGFNFALVLCAAAVVIASLVFNIIIYQKINKTPDEVSSTAAPPVTSTTEAPQVKGCRMAGPVSNSAAWQQAASQLLRGIDRNADPCDDFYQFTCSRYIKNTTNAKSPASESQSKVNVGIAANLKELNTKTATQTELIAKKAYDLCAASMMENPSDPKVKLARVNEVQADLLKIVDFPLFGFNDGSGENFTIEGLARRQARAERHFLTTILYGSGVSVDYMDKSKMALYIDQPGLSKPRDYYVLPQFIADIEQYTDDIEAVLVDYATVLNLTSYCDGETPSNKTCIRQTVEWMVDFERQIAMASWAAPEMRNFQQQYNPFSLDALIVKFPSLALKEYVMTLLDGLIPQSTDDAVDLLEGVKAQAFDQKVVISQPTYFEWLNAKIASGEVTIDQLVNYLAISFLADTTDYSYLGVGNDMIRSIHDGNPKGLASVQPPAVRRGRGVRKMSYQPMHPILAKTIPQGVQSYCVEMLIVYVLYAPGYVYVKNRDDRDKVQADVRKQTNYIVSSFREMIDTLPWMTDETKDRSKNKIDNLVSNIGWPDWFGDFNNATDRATVDLYHQDYKGILDATTYWEASRVMKYGMETQEFFRQLFTEMDRTFFLQSPAMVNAWYQPERNSITFPLANMNPPYYSIDFPQVYNYAGQGSTGGHELTHGFDDFGVQFGPEGGLDKCDFTRCGFIDDESRKGFVDMAQCVVTQFNGQCCPISSGNVRCANGANTQGENIADIGGSSLLYSCRRTPSGLQAALRAYKAYLKNENKGKPEALLPGLEDFTVNQIFWMTYGFGWCSRASQTSIVHQLMTNVHSPSSCRVNQVIQDIPQFGRDFMCAKQSPMVPSEENRCKVWIGY